MSPVHMRILIVGTALAANSVASDCCNDEPPARTDLEPPIPGHDGYLLRITDQDIGHMREAMEAHEQRQDTVAGGASRQPRR